MSGKKIKAFNHLINKYSGAGNSFLITDELNLLLNSELRLIIQKICSNSWGLGADGFIFLNRLEPDFFEWNFFNSDGSSAEMCGNASRCVGAFCFEKYGLFSIRLKTIFGTVFVNKIEGGYETSLPKIAMIEKNKIISVNGQQIQGDLINSGVPHFVIRLKNSNEKDLFKDILPLIRFHSDFGRSGANVSFCWSDVNDTIGAITYERGVENYTAACGTGALAVGLSTKEITSQSHLKIKMPGGLLGVNLENLERPLLIGPAIHISELKWSGEIHEKV